ncbi:hypothetical protein HKD37_06G017612 [Glycine soja]
MDPLHQHPRISWQAWKTVSLSYQPHDPSSWFSRWKTISAQSPQFFLPEVTHEASISLNF